MLRVESYCLRALLLIMAVYSLCRNLKWVSKNIKSNKTKTGTYSKRLYFMITQTNIEVNETTFKTI